MIQKINNPLELCQLKFSNEGKGEFVGYAATFGNIDSYRDTIMPGSFTETIAEKRIVPMFVNHDSWAIPVGKYTDLKEDDTGLLVTGAIDMNHKDGSSLYSALKNKTMDALSIGFRIRKGGAYEDEETMTRVITNIDLKEISPVNFPADNDARISVVKNDIQEIETLKDAEAFLRDSGYSKAAATAFVSRIRKLKQGDPAVNDEITKHDMTNQLVDFINNVRI